MKTTILLILVIFLANAFLVGCGSSGGSGGGAGGNDGPSDGVPAVHEYVYKIYGNGITYAGNVYIHFGESDQAESPMSQHMISASGTESFTVYGRTTLGQFVLRSNGTMIVELYKNGALVASSSVNSINQQVAVGEGN